jgi:hypothetical protein
MKFVPSITQAQTLRVKELPFTLSPLLNELSFALNTILTQLIYYYKAKIFRLLSLITIFAMQLKLAITTTSKINPIT